MPLYKKGTCPSSIVVSSTVYVCSSCEYTEIVKGDPSMEKRCPKCDSQMKIVSSQSEGTLAPENS